MLNAPEAALVFGLLAILLFRKDISLLLARTEKIKGWFVASKQPALPTPSDQALPTRNPEEEQRGFEQLTKGFDNQLLLLQEESIRVDLAQAKLSAETPSEKVLLRHLAGTQIALAFADIYRLIYRSQVQALRWLNGQSAGIDASALHVFYEDGAKQWPMLYGNFDFQAWLGFLAARGLVTESEESSTSPDDAEPFGVQITVMGRAFLAYLVTSGRADPAIG